LIAKPSMDNPESLGDGLDFLFLQQTCFLNMSSLNLFLALWYEEYGLK